jgi:hypothetical protein
MRVRLAVCFSFGVALAFGSCRWSEVPQNAVYACDQNRTCPEGYACVQDYCFLATSVQTDGGGGGNGGGSGGSGGGSGCASASAAAACTDAGLQCGEAALPDGCGDVRSYNCSSCADGGICRNNFCCAVPSAQAYCTDAGYGCGLRELQACGQSLQVNCGNCTSGMTCVSDDHSASCQPCVPEGDPEFCERYAATCGQVTGTDNCGAPRTVTSCGTCDDGGCGSSAGSNLCECRQDLSTCRAGSNCCSGSCGDAGLCCQPLTAACADDANCCSGFCALGVCIPPTDGGHGNGR